MLVFFADMNTQEDQGAPGVQNLGSMRGKCNEKSN